jgi:polygalacturonase
VSPAGSGPSVREYGALGDGISPDGKAIQAAIDAVGSAGGGEVVLPPGGYVSGSLFLRDGVALRIERGATLLGSRDPRDYPLIESRWEGRTRVAHAPLVGASGARGVGVSGGGAIDGRGEEWWALFRAGALERPRPTLMTFDRCEGVLLEGFEARNSPSWTVHPVRSHNVIIRGLTILSPPDSPNTDGIDPDSCDSVRIADCFVSVGDDCIAIKAGAEGEEAGAGGPCENVVVTGCVLERGHGGVVVGSEMSGGVRDVLVADCVFRGTDRGIRVKTRRGRGGAVERVRASGIVMEDCLVPFAVNSHYGCGAWDDPVVGDLGAREIDEGTPRISELSFSAITASGARLAAAWIDGLAEMPIRGLSFADVSIELGGDADAAPPEMSPGAPALSRSGFRANNVSGLRLSNVRIGGQRGPAYVLQACRGARHSFCDPVPAWPFARVSNKATWR